MKSGRQSILLRLTDAQRRLIFDRTGLSLEVLDLSPVSFVAAAIVGEALASGETVLGTPNPLVLSLTPAQTTQLSKDAPRAATHLFVNADALRLTHFTEDWGPAPSVRRVGTLRIAIRPRGNTRPEEGPEPTASIYLEASEDDHANVFGSGQHPTTRLALEGLSQLPVARKRVIDIGTGSGILAIGAARLGAASVTAIDNDQRAVEQARTNVKLNSLEKTITVREGSTTGLNGTWDVVIANLLIGVLLQEAASLARLLDETGTLLLSGIPSPRLPDIIATCSSNRLDLVSVASLPGWSAITLVRSRRESRYPLGG